MRRQLVAALLALWVTGAHAQGVSTPTAIAGPQGPAGPAACGQGDLDVNCRLVSTSPTLTAAAATNLALMQAANALPIFGATAHLTIANTATAGTLFPAGTGSLSFAANSLTQGRVLHVHGDGHYSTAAVAPTLAITTTLGSATLVSVTAGSLVALTSNAPYVFDEYVQVMSVGTSGAVQVSGTLAYQTTAGARTYVDISAPSVAIDTTSAQTLNVTGAWGTASLSNTLTTGTVYVGSN